jgi:hypothetical protein
MFPNGEGGMVYVDYDFQDQLQNWSGNSKAQPGNNGDLEIRTHWVVPGIQYMFSRTWGINAEVPYENRYFKTTSGVTGNVVSLNWGDIGDVRVRAIYTGLSDDESIGVTFGLKLPSGNYTYNDANGDIDRDTEIGSGSTDLLLGGYYRNNFTNIDGLGWFAQVLVDVPFMFRDGYRPGAEADGAIGLTYEHWSIGGLSITPVAQLLGSIRDSDSGPNASGGQNQPDQTVGYISSGYYRLLVSPGLEVDLHPWMFYADAEFPVFQHLNGKQLVAPVLVKASVSYMF